MGWGVKDGGDTPDCTFASTLIMKDMFLDLKFLIETMYFANEFH